MTIALRSFREGDRVKAVVISVEMERHRISFGLKPSYFAEDDFVTANKSDDEQHETLGVVDGVPDIDDDAGDDHHETLTQLDEDEDDEDEDDEDEDDEMQVDTNVDLNATLAARGQRTSVPTLQLGGGFQWSAPVVQDDQISACSDDEGEETEGTKKKRRRRKGIEQDLTADLHTKTPDSNADFERVLLGSPNSSFLWVQYMSFQLQLAEVDKAREIGRRALRTINFREEQEKLNVWIALLNLESIYGTEESLDVTFKDAARHNDSKTVHLRLATILDQSGKIEVSIANTLV